MNLKSEIFANFDFTCLNDREFKEDSVREEIISPLLKSIGWSASGKNRIIRGRSLAHPYVMFGSTKKKLKIIPDYVLEIDGKPCFVLDAKAPDQEILEGDNVSQVYSYAIHPDIRVTNYGLCNGKTLALFDITSINPKHVYDLSNLTDIDIIEINQRLNSRSISEYEIFNYDLDGGIYLHFAMHASVDQQIIFPCVSIYSIARLDEETYSTSVLVSEIADRDLMFTFDFNDTNLQQLISFLPSQTSKDVLLALSQHPFRYENNISPLLVNIFCNLSNKPEFSRKGEMFFPMKVLKFSC